MAAAADVGVERDAVLIRDAIGGSVLRACARHGLDAPATQALVDGIRAGEP